jgi:hypothetical protein
MNKCLPCTKGLIYRIQKGETMAGIAQCYGIPYKRLMEANPQILHPHRIHEGLMICIPEPEEE